MALKKKNSGKDTKAVQVYMSKELAERVKTVAKEQDRSMSWIIVKLIYEALAAREERA